MSPTRRIILNIIATYGRSIYALVLGLFCGRWILCALGHLDYGLMGLVGGLVGFVSFLNSIMASAISRFFAVEAGAAKRQGNESEGLKTCIRWFNTALLIHTTIPVVLVIIGYPIGIWAIENFLDIPSCRIADCIIVWRFSCLSCFISMFSVPFNAMYFAKQEIAELTIYSVVQTTLNAIFVYYMVSHPGVWLTRYVGWSCILAILPQLIITTRAVLSFKECKFVVGELFNINRIKQICYYVAARFVSDFAVMFENQGKSILVNKYMGPTYNASMTVGNTVASHAVAFFGAMQGAFCPAIFNKAGEGDMAATKNLSYMTFRLGLVLVLIFAMPIVLEAKEILRLWLVNPPDFAEEICIALLFVSVIESIGQAFGFSILALGKKVMFYSCSIGIAVITTVFIVWILFHLGMGMWSVVIGLPLAKILGLCVRLYFGHTVLHYKIGEWALKIGLPAVLIICVVLSMGSVPRFLLSPSLSRVIIVASACELTLFPMAWWILFTSEERAYVISRLTSIKLSLQRAK